MIQNIRAEFKIMIKEYEWMDEFSKKAVQDKVNTLMIKIGYPDRILDNDYLTNYYLNVKLY
jgi:predicted metalloendopeptidase